MASGGAHQALFDKSPSYVRSFLSAGGHTLFEYPLGKTFEAKVRLLQEFAGIGQIRHREHLTWEALIGQVTAVAP